MASRTYPKNRLVLVIFVTTMVWLYTPLLYLIVQAFLENPYEWSHGFSLKWVTKLFSSATLWEPLRNSLIVAILAASASLILGTLGAVTLSPHRILLPTWLHALITLPVMVPEVITGLSLLLFFLLLRIELGMSTVILAHASFSSSFVYFIVVEQLRKLDPNLREAALDLGAEPRALFWKITLPNILPGLMGAWLFAFTLSFDDFLISFFTSGAGFTTLPLKIYSLMRLGITPEVNALSATMILISTALVLVALSREQTRKWVLKGF